MIHGVSNFRKTRLLVIEDVRYIARFLEYTLQKEGYEVAVAHSGEQALETIDSFKPDGILLDLMLPGISGFDVLKYLRSLEMYRETIVIVLTARSFEETPSDILESGANSHCAKPIAPSTLFRTLLKFGLPPVIEPGLQYQIDKGCEYANT
jgi:DNA-binding response OmpR family regulator